MNEQRIELLKKYIEEEPKNPFNQYALAMEYYDSIPEEALSILKHLISNHKDYLPSYYKAAHLLWEDENWEEAETIFNQGIALARSQNDQKSLGELQASYQNFLFEKD